MMGILYSERLKKKNPEYLNRVTSSDLFLISMVSNNTILSLCERNRKFLLSYRNASRSLGELKMLWEHKLTAFSSSPKLS